MSDGTHLPSLTRIVKSTGKRILLNAVVVVDVPSYTGPTVIVVLGRLQLVCMPDEIDVQRWYEERGGGCRHKV